LRKDSVCTKSSQESDSSKGRRQKIKRGKGVWVWGGEGRGPGHDLLLVDEGWKRIPHSGKSLHVKEKKEGTR